MGRLAVTGPTGCRYLDDENQRKYVQQGWNLTGDAYRHDADGYFWYEARTDDMIVTSGYNVSGVEIENVLIAHASVGECAVVGVPDEARGQIVKAFVVPAAGVARIGCARARAAGLREVRAGALQVSARDRVRGGVAADADGQAATVPVAQGAGDPAPAVRAGGVAARTGGLAEARGYANAASATGRVVFVSGQVGWDPVTMTFPPRTSRPKCVRRSRMSSPRSTPPARGRIRSRD